MISWLVDPWQHTFMQHAFLAIILVGIICGAIGVFVILRGLAFLGDALAHAIFPGVVVAFILGGNFLIGALIAAVLVSLGIGGISQGGRITNDTAVGVLFVGAFSLGIALMSTRSGYTRDLNTFLFGSILGVTVTTRRTRGDAIEAACGQLAGDVADRTRRRNAGAPRKAIPVRELGA